MMARLLVSVGLALAGFALYRGWQTWQSRRLSGLSAPGRPTLLYFGSPECAPCVFQQTPAVAAVSAWLGDTISVKQVDVNMEPEMATRWHVMTLPTTVVLDPAGDVRAINPGVTSAQKLQKQLFEAGDRKDIRERN